MLLLCPDKKYPHFLTYPYLVKFLKTHPVLLPPNNIILLDKVAFMRAEYLYAAIVLFVFVSLILVIIMLLIILHKKSRLKNRRNTTARLEEWLMDVILENNEGDNHQFLIPGDIMLLLQNRHAKKVLLRELMNVKKSLSGISGDNIEKIYKQLNLKEISLRRVASKHWHIKARGIQELAIMHQQPDNDQLFKLTNDKDLMVRMEAQTAIVRLQGYKGLSFFDNLSFPLSEWHQLNLLFLLAPQPIVAGDGILNWLHSPNATVVQFSLKLIAGQHASEFHEEVVRCLNHPVEVVRNEAILCLGQMPSAEAADELQKRYIIEPDKNIKLSIIGELQQTGSGADLPFLEMLQTADDADIKLAANKTVLYLLKIL